jgi:hypothetical protein
VGTHPQQSITNYATRKKRNITIDANNNNNIQKMYSRR